MSITYLVKNMRIVLVTPPFDLMRKGYGSKQKLKAGFFPPLGIGYLAAMQLKKGHIVKIIDAPPMNYTNEDILRDIAIFAPQIIGISSLSASSEEAYALIKFLKLKLPNTPIIFGGAHATCFPTETFKNVSELDCLVYGEGEKAFDNIIDSMSNLGKIKTNIPGTWIRLKSGKIKINKPSETYANIDDIPMPAWKLYNPKTYAPLPLQYKKLPVANIITSRGCPWGKCTFCFESGRAAQRYRRHSPTRVVSEIKILIETYGIKEITFWDDNFLINEKWIFEFCDLLDSSSIKIPWSACGRVNTVTQLMLERVKKSGCWCIFYGFETGNEDLLRRIKKGATLDQARQAAKWTHQLGIDTRGSFMLALPGETYKKALKTIGFAKELDVTFAQFLPTHPEWGTELYDDAINNGLFVPHYGGRTNITYVPHGYKNADEVRAMQKRAYHSFYFRPKFIIKHLKRLKSLDIIKQYYDGVLYILGIST